MEEKSILLDNIRTCRYQFYTYRSRINFGSFKSRTKHTLTSSKGSICNPRPLQHPNKYQEPSELQNIRSHISEIILHITIWHLKTLVMISSNNSHNWKISLAVTVSTCQFDWRDCEAPPTSVKTVCSCSMVFSIELDGMEFVDTREGSECDPADFSTTLSQDAMMCLWPSMYVISLGLDLTPWTSGR